MFIRKLDEEVNNFVFEINCIIIKNGLKIKKRVM